MVCNRRIFFKAIRVDPTFDSDGEEESDNDSEAPQRRKGIGSYSVEAEILRVFVERNWFPSAVNASD